MNLRKFLIYIITGICFALAFPPFNLYTLIIVGFVLLLFIIDSCKNYKELIKSVYFVFLVFDFVAVSWLPLSGMHEGADRFLILGGVFTLFFHSSFHLVPAVIYFFVIRRFKFDKLPNLYLIAFPFIWTAFEFCQTYGEISFPWVVTGNAFSSNLSKIQFIEFIGVFGISFWAITISILLYYSLKKYLANAEFKKKSFAILFLVIVLYFLPDVYSALTHKEKIYTNKKDTGTFKVGVVQPNINPWKKWGSQQMSLVGDYINLLKELKKKYPDVTFAVYPETAFPFYLLDPFYNEKYSAFKTIADSLGIAVLTGTPDFTVYTDSSRSQKDSKKFNSSGQYYDTYNSAVLLDKKSDRGNIQKYNKFKLVPASERMPYQEYIPFLKKFMTWGVGISSYQKGADTTVFTLDNGIKFNTAICYESIYPEFFSCFINKGAQFSVIITNDGWWGKLFGTHQHNQYAVLRAVENRRWIVRCANTGISCIIDPYGNMFDRTEINETTFFAEEVGLSNEKTFFTRNGDLTGRICIYFSLVFIIAGASFKRKQV